MGWMDWLGGSPSPVLQGERVMLRPPARSDFEAWRALRGASRSFLTPWEPAWNIDELSANAFAARLARYRQDARQGAGRAFFLFSPDGTTLYGGITLSLIRRGVSQSAFLGYWMGEAHAGQGLMREAVRLTCAYAFEAERLHRVEAACLPRNARSIALLRNSGFAREGLLRSYLRIAGVWEDHDLYALLAEDWSVSARRDLATPPRPRDQQEIHPTDNA